ncbi:MAG: response regulator transcription factor [Bacteroidetes bacterium]|nr:response regulator transcription factor [Bacteroidota bacterium]
MQKKIQIAVVDDHKLFRSGLINLIHSLDPSFVVSTEANNGRELLDLLSVNTLPDIILLDANMPVMDGYETAAALQQRYPEIKVLVVTMNDDEQSLIRMLKLGVKGYIGKDVDPNELRHALCELMNKGFHYTDQLTNQLIQSLTAPEKMAGAEHNLTEQELIFIRLACSEDTYAQIADAMHLSPKTIDGYRASVFEKLNIKSRVGLAIYAIKAGLVDLNQQT